MISKIDKYLHNVTAADRIKFTVECEMDIESAAHFLGMLKYMQYLGNVGSSRMIHFNADGDGPFRPKFNWDSKITPSEGHDDGDGNKSF